MKARSDRLLKFRMSFTLHFRVTHAEFALEKFVIIAGIQELNHRFALCYITVFAARWIVFKYKAISDSQRYFLLISKDIILWWFTILEGSCHISWAALGLSKISPVFTFHITSRLKDIPSEHFWTYAHKFKSKINL